MSMMDRAVVYSVNRRDGAALLTFRCSSPSPLSGFLEHFKRWTELFRGEELLCSGLEASYWPQGILE